MEWKDIEQGLTKFVIEVTLGLFLLVALVVLAGWLAGAY